MEKQGTRRAWVDTLRGLGVILVIMGHMYWTNANVLVYIYSFHIPLFFFISGLVLKHDDLEAYRPFLLARVRSRFVPYLFFYIISYCIEVLIAIAGSGASIDAIMRSDESRLSILNAIGGMFYGNGRWFFNINNVALWFLPSLIVVEQVFYLLSRWSRGDKRSLAAAVFIAMLVGFVAGSRLPLLPWSADASCVAVVFYACGHALGMNRVSEWIRRMRGGVQKWFCFILFGSAGGVCALLNGRVDMNTKLYGNHVLFLAAAFLGIFAFIALASLMEKSRTLQFFGRNSLILFCMHTHMFFPSARLIEFAGQGVAGRAYAMGQDAFLAGMLALTFLMLVPCVFLINKYLPFAVGKKRYA